MGLTTPTRHMNIYGERVARGLCRVCVLEKVGLFSVITRHLDSGISCVQWMSALPHILRPRRDMIMKQEKDASTLPVILYI